MRKAPGICVACGALGPIQGRGLCTRDYQRARRAEQVAAAPPPGLPADFDARLQAIPPRPTWPAAHCPTCGRRIGDGCPVCAPDLRHIYKDATVAGAQWTRYHE